MFRAARTNGEGFFKTSLMEGAYFTVNNPKEIEEGGKACLLSVLALRGPKRALIAV